MAVVDYEAAWHDLRGRLRSTTGPDGGARSSWGRGHLLEVLDELEVANRIDESVDRRVLRRFAGALIDTFMGLLPRNGSTGDPLEHDDRPVCRCRANGADPTYPGLRCVNAGPGGCRLETSRAMAAGELSPMTGGHDGNTDEASRRGG